MNAKIYVGGLEKCMCSNMKLMKVQLIQVCPELDLAQPKLVFLTFPALLSYNENTCLLAHQAIDCFQTTFSVKPFALS